MVVIGKQIHKTCSFQGNRLSCNGDWTRYVLNRNRSFWSSNKKRKMLITAHMSEIVQKREGFSVKQDKQDRRSLRTRHLVHAALMELMLEKRYEAITVRDILDRAGIGSSTFYTHYFDKEDVYTDLFDQIFQHLLHL